MLPLGEGPDIFISANDVLGGLVADGLVEPLDLTSVADDFAQGAIDAFTFGGLTYALPYATESVALIRNTDLVPEAPATFEELEEIALALVASGDAEIPLAVQAGGGAPYHYFPLYSAFGGYVFGINADGSFNFEDVGLASEAGLAAADAFAGVGSERAARLGHHLRHHAREVRRRLGAVRDHRPVGAAQLRGRELRGRADPVFRVGSPGVSLWRRNLGRFGRRRRPHLVQGRDRRADQEHGAAARRLPRSGPSASAPRVVD